MRTNSSFRMVQGSALALTLIMTAIALAPLLSYPTRFTDLGRLRVQESERVVALRTE